MRVHLGGVETLLRHERFGAVRGALALAADAVEVDVVAHDMGDVDFGLLAREGGEANLAAAIDHAGRFVDRVRRAGALDHVVDALAAVEPPHRFDRDLPW